MMPKLRIIWRTGFTNEIHKYGSPKIFPRGTENQPSQTDNMVIHADWKTLGEYARNYNVPDAFEVVATITGNEGEEITRWYIVVRRRVVFGTNGNEVLASFSITEPTYNTLRYMSLFYEGAIGDILSSGIGKGIECLEKPLH